MATKSKTDETQKHENSTRNEQKESFKVKGEDLLAKVKQLVHEGNIREISIQDKEGKTIMVIPLTIGVVGVLLAPVWAAVGAVAALVTECTITVKRRQ